jgi:hypothetical protein
MFRFQIPGQDPAQEQVEGLASDVAGLKAQIAGLRSLEHWLALATNPKAVSKHVDELTALTVQAIEAKAAAEKAQADLAERKAKLDRYEERVDARAVELYTRQCAHDEKQSLLLKISADIRESGDRFKREIIRYAGMVTHDLSDLPDWSALAADVLGVRDAHFSDEQVARDASVSMKIEPVSSASKEATITRSVPRSRSAERREALSRQ